MPPTGTFVFTTCQRGAEGALKGELLKSAAGLRLAFSRPGFLSFKLAEGETVGPDFDPGAVFARNWSVSLGPATGENATDVADQVWQLAQAVPVTHLHVWEPDRQVAGHWDYEPAVSEGALEAQALLLERRPLEQAPVKVGRAKRGDLVLDCVVLEPGRWMVGYHRAEGSSRFPGGLWPLKLPEYAASRAYLKLAEALNWARFPFKSRQWVAELGAAPGGSTQALLDRKLRVIGIDPAEMDPRVLEQPGFVQLRRRSRDVPLRRLANCRWLMADMNAVPSYTLDAAEEIVTSPHTRIRGMILTLKLTDWALAEEIPDYLARIRQWGYKHVAARQLQFNRQEITVLALQSVKRKEPPQTALEENAEQEVSLPSKSQNSDQLSGSEEPL